MSSDCCAGECGGPRSISRRGFLRAAAASAGIVVAPRTPFAGPFQSGPDEFPIPADKKFDRAWENALFERGEPTVYRRSKGELDKIGMPIGGICAGQLHLGGDGKLWLWDLFNLPCSDDRRSGNGPHYAAPVTPSSPIEQGFALRITSGGTTTTRFLDGRSGHSSSDPSSVVAAWPEIEFRGQYPIGFVKFVDTALPVEVELEAFSPFIPLEEDESGLPATVMSYTVKNVSAAPVTVEIAGWIENGVGLGADPAAAAGSFVRRNDAARAGTGALLLARAESAPPAPTRAEPRPDVVVDDFEHAGHAGWTVTGTAFGDGPIARNKLPAYQGDVNAHGERLVNSHQTRNGEDVAAGDAHVGRMTSAEFVLDRDYLSFRIGGGNHPGTTCLNLQVDGKVVRTATGRDQNRMRLERFDVREFAGRSGRIEIVDEERGGWGNVGVDEIVLTDVPRLDLETFEERPDFGTLALSTIGSGEDVVHVAIGAVGDGELPEAAFKNGDPAPRPFPRQLVGSVVRTVTLAPGERATLSFVVAWHFDGLWRDSLSFLPEARSLRRFYGTRFRDAADVVRHVAGRFERLAGLTRRWHRAWYVDSTLPWWFLERTLASASTLATSTCLRFADRRFWGWEGTYCCAGTCTHVWGYAQAVARLFPALERDLRERVDFGIAFHPDGRIDYRAEAARDVAIDGQCGVVLRTWREHLTSRDGEFLARVWPRVRLAVEQLLAHDPDQDGLLDGAQYNTLDAAWYGAISWTSSLYLAALRAGEAMARERDDDGFAQRCGAVAARGYENLPRRLFNGEWFVHEPDPAHPESNSTGKGCHIDQLFGQSWAHQVGLPRIVPRENSIAALRSLYRWSFAPDVGPYRRFMEGTIGGGRWYAMPGEAGLLMCTWPKGGAEAATGRGSDAWAAGYFNECMSGFEHQVASHMIREGLVVEGLAVTRAIHDRYHAARRNPWNEVECSDHYARAMASYGSFLAACGFDHHGPRGHLGFAPRLAPDRFAAAFTAAGAWGRIAQDRDGALQTERIVVDHGRLRLATLAFELRDGAAPSSVTVTGPTGKVACRFERRERRLDVLLAREVDLGPGEELRVVAG